MIRLLDEVSRYISLNASLAFLLGLAALIARSLEQPREGASSATCQASQVGLLSLRFACVAPVIDPWPCGLSVTRRHEIDCLPRGGPVLAVMSDPLVLEEKSLIASDTRVKLALEHDFRNLDSLAAE